MLELWQQARRATATITPHDSYLNFYGPAGTIPNIGLGEILTGQMAGPKPIGGWTGAAVIIGLFEPRELGPGQLSDCLWRSAGT